MAAVLASMALLAAGCVANSDHDTESAAEARAEAKAQTNPMGDDPSLDTTGGDSDDSGESDGGDGSGGAVDELEIQGVEFVEGDCGFDVTPALSPRCGTVFVPMDWETGAGTIELAVAVFPSTAATPAPDPVVYLEGGPGGHALETLTFVESSLLEPLLERGDVVVFDQRGAGLSEPQLGCPEVTAADRELEDAVDISDADADELFHAALGECSARLTADGVDLASFTTVNNAHDVEAIRVALGYEQWNLHGVSYGTRLALEVMRQHHGGVRSVVIDSVFPPQVDPVLENPATFVASYERVVAACAAESACAALGGLDERLAAVVARYQDDPAQVTVENFLTGEEDEVYLDGERIVGIVTQALYSPVWFSDLPELVAGLEEGDTTAAKAFLDQQRTNEAFFSPGMFYAFVCNEEVSFADPGDVEAALPPDPFGLGESFNTASNNGPNAFQTCDAFGSTPAEGLSNEAVVSDIPTLVMAGAFDPVTPVAWAEAAAETLANSHLVIHPGESHGISSDSCGSGILTSFLDDPAATPDTSCFDDAELRFLGPPTEPVSMEPYTRPGAGGSEIVTVRPEGWTYGSLPGDSYRQATFLDPTQLIQVQGDPQLTFGLESYLADRFEVTLDSTSESVSVGGRTWSHRSGSTEAAAADWYDGEVNEVDVIVLLVSTPDERQANIEAVLMPVLEAIDTQ